MGGQGSGNFYRWNKKAIVEESYQLGIDFFKEILNNLYTGGMTRSTISWKNTITGETSARISYEIERKNKELALLTFEYSITPGDSEREDLRYSSPLVTTHCNYGGFRWWYLCPNTHCRNRVGKLYMPYHARYFLCRNCHNLTYESCQESHKFDRLYAQIGADTGVPPNVAKRLLAESFK
jgi:hypothetical protein